MSAEDTEALLEDCTQCGLCREVCIVEKLGAHSITSFLCGEKEYSSWLCSSCWRCQEVCPQGVDIHSIIMEKRREEEPPAGHQSNLVNVLRFGYALPVDQSINELRDFHGLDAVEFPSQAQLDVLLEGVEVGASEE